MLACELPYIFACLSSHIFPRYRIFKSLVGSSPIHCTWVVTGSSMATYWANLALAPVNGFSILNHLPLVHLPTRVEDNVLERARSVLRQEFLSTLPEPLLQFSAAYTVAELVFYSTEWYRLGASAAKPPLEFCLDTLADKVYPEVRTLRSCVRPDRRVTCLRADCFRLLARAERNGSPLTSTGGPARQL